ncbi:FAD-dependent monooxygenase [Streptomyces sp. NPDC051172]|uniref:FAD-dependent monooxygenase n=1 Tax=Streptomyces sp. NPDC051172 TaxID=3155796 RepID=UPI00342DD35D
MTAEAQDTDVIVVGAGPVGLFLAGDLRARGTRVTVLERLDRPTTESRASTLHARTMEILAERGLLERFGELPGGGTGHFGGIPLDLTAADPGHPLAGQWKCPQTRIEAVLHQWATDLGARVLRGHTVDGLLQEEHRVRVTARTADGAVRTFTATHLVGCDGEDSAVRRLAGFELGGHAATVEMLRADVAGLDIPDRRFERHPEGMATSYRWPDGTTRVMVHLHGHTPEPRSGEPDFAEIVTAWARTTGEDISGGSPLWLNAFDDASFQTTRYLIGRVLLAGDAAHIQMPVGGMALNLGLQDAAELGPILAAHTTGAEDRSPLDDYDERRAVGARTLTHIAAQARLLLGGPEVDALRTVFGELLGLDAVRGHLARTIVGLPVRPASTPS